MEVDVEARNRANWDAFERTGERASWLVGTVLFSAVFLWVTTNWSWITIRASRFGSIGEKGRVVFDGTHELTLAGSDFLNPTYAYNNSVLATGWIDMLFGTVPAMLAALVLSGLATWFACTVRSRLIGWVAAVPAGWTMLEFANADLNMEMFVGPTGGDFNVEYSLTGAFKVFYLSGLVVSVAAALLAVVAPYLAHRAWHIAEDFEVALTGRAKRPGVFKSKARSPMRRGGAFAGGLVAALAAGNSRTNATHAANQSYSDWNHQQLQQVMDQQVQHQQHMHV